VTNPDFRDLFSALSAEAAEFLVVGAHAVMVYTEPRYTKDLVVAHCGTGSLIGGDTSCRSRVAAGRAAHLVVSESVVPHTSTARLGSRPLTF